MECVAGEMLASRTEVGRQRAVRPGDLARKHADAIIRRGIRESVPQAAPVVRLDVRDTVTRPANVDVVPVAGIGHTAEQHCRYP